MNLVHIHGSCNKQRPDVSKREITTYMYSQGPKVIHVTPKNNFIYTLMYYIFRLTRISLLRDIKILFVCFVALRPESTAVVMAGRSVHLPHFFLGKLLQAVNQYFVTMKITL